MDSEKIALIAGIVVTGGVAIGITMYNWNRFFTLPGPSTAEKAPARAADGDRDAEFTLYQGLSKLVGPSGSLSQFCLKVEAFLRAAGIPFKSKNASPTTAPKGKVPFAKHGKTIISDSADIIRYLVNTFTKDEDLAESSRSGDAKGHLGDLILPGAMDPSRLAVAKAAEAVLEHRLYHYTVRVRWLEKFDLFEGLFFGAVPAAIRWLIVRMVRRSVSDSLKYHGITAHARDDITRREHEDWDTIASLVGGTDTEPGYLGGDGPCVQDCTLFACLDNLLNTPVASSGKEYVMEHHPKLVRFCDRFRERFFPDKPPVPTEVRVGNVVMMEDKEE